MSATWVTSPLPVQLLRRWDLRTLVLAGICLVLALGSWALEATGGLERELDLGLPDHSAAVAAAAAAWCIVRGRLREAECVTVLLLVLTVSTVGAMSFSASSLRWAVVYGLAGIPMVTLMIARVRWGILVTGACLICQTVLVSSVVISSAQLAVCLSVVAGALPLFVGYTALLLARAEVLRQ